MWYIHTISRVYQHPSFTDLTTDLWTPWSHQQEQLSQTESCTPWPLILYTASTFCQMNKLENKPCPPPGYTCISAPNVIFYTYFIAICSVSSFYPCNRKLELENIGITGHHIILITLPMVKSGIFTHLNPTVFSSTLVLKSTRGYTPCYPAI